MSTPLGFSPGPEAPEALRYFAIWPPLTPAAPFSRWFQDEPRPQLCQHSIVLLQGTPPRTTDVWNWYTAPDRGIEHFLSDDYSLVNDGVCD